MSLSLSGKRAVVCGSTDGIGKATAYKLAEQGAEIILVARNPKKLDKTLHDLPVKNDQNHNMICADFNLPEELEKHISELSDFVHILVNNSGGPPGGPLVEAKKEEFRLAFERHVICNQILAKAFVPCMKELGFGRIINIISTSVKQVIPGLGVSNTTRGAVANWARTLALELGQFGITVNNILPGYTDTGRLQSLAETRAKEQGVTVDDIRAGWVKSVPLARIGKPDEIASAVSFLASDAAGYINGADIPVDGGRVGI
ncbi:uncharacterized protein METZ01_LOCUS115833 [marine metagenome]|uniref:Short-chain dehydrogenase n=1 Tax=marine metagenome TaxID=408172 RepID=A0A381XE00_9ZZZZ